MLEVQNQVVNRVGSLEALREYYGLNCAPLSHSYVEALIPNVTILPFEGN